jgi:hypothetical protein
MLIEMVLPPGGIWLRLQTHLRKINLINRPPANGSSGHVMDMARRLRTGN